MNIITKPEQKKKLVPLKEVPDFSVVRWVLPNGKAQLFFKPHVEDRTTPMEHGAAFPDGDVEVVECDLVLKS